MADLLMTNQRVIADAPTSINQPDKPALVHKHAHHLSHRTENSHGRGHGSNPAPADLLFAPFSVMAGDRVASAFGQAAYRCRLAFIVR